MKFLTEWSKSDIVNDDLKTLKTVMAQIGRILDKPGEWSTAMAKIIKQLDGIRDRRLPSWNRKVAEVISQLKCLQSVSQPSDLRSLAEDITTTLHCLKDNADFTLLLKGEMKFIGSLHCEACLASLLALLLKGITPNSTYEDILMELKNARRIIGISKRCCPACEQLLHLLAGQDPFLVRGFHSTVTACTLPVWLPPRVVDAMNASFGLTLREELIKFMDCPELARNRTQSSGSQKLSQDGRHEPEQLRTADYPALLAHVAEADALPKAAG